MKRLALVIASSLLAAVVLSWPRAVLSHETVNTTVLFDREIVGILDRHCVMCHADGGPSFPLATYEQVWLQKRPISAAVLARHMPPWAAVPGYGRFANENVVTLRESQFIVSWMEGLGPRNAGRVFTNTAAPAGDRRAPAVQARADFEAWHLGEPDLVRELDEVVLEPGREDEVKRVVVDLGAGPERRVRAVEFLPGDRRVVRAAFFTVQETGQWIGSWTPWYGFIRLPPGVAFSIPPRTHLVAEIHYRHMAERVVDRGRLGLFLETRPSRRAVDVVLVAAREREAAAAGAVRFRADRVLDAETSLLALNPEIVPGVQSVEVSARLPDGSTNVLLFAKNFSTAWPSPYIFKEPIVLRRGTRLSMIAYGDAGLSAQILRLTISSYAPRPAGN